MGREAGSQHRSMATVERAMSLVRVLEGSSRDLGTNEIARLTGLNASTVSRLLATLASEGWVSRSEETGRFRLGPRLVELGNAALARIDVRERCPSHLRRRSPVAGAPPGGRPQPRSRTAR